MKAKCLFISITILFAQRSLSQNFNHLISNYYYNIQDRQTIVTDWWAQDINFLSVNQGSPNFPKDIELVKLDASGNYLLSKRVFDTLGNLTPGSIIATYDSCYIVVGEYNGTPPSGYPHAAGSPIKTTFYSKFDRNFNLLWFKLHYGYPLAQPHTISRQVYPYGIVAVPNGTSENYIILNQGKAYDTVAGSNINLILIDKIDPSGNLIKEVHANMPGPSTGTVNYPVTISYLPANNLCVINGMTQTATQKIFLFTFDPALTTVYNFTYYHTSTYLDYTPSNVVEDQTDTGNILFYYITADPSSYPLTCTSGSKLTTLMLMKVKAHATSTILLSEDLTSSCMQEQTPPLTIQNIPGYAGQFMLGFTDLEPGGTSSLSYPAMMAMDVTGNVNSFHIYNPTETNSRLQYFNTNVADTLVMHVNRYIDTATQGTRIIKTDRFGASYCTDTPGVDTSHVTIATIDSPITLTADSTVLFSDHPVLHIDSFPILHCDSAYHRSLPSSITNYNTGMPSISIYPNPTRDILTIAIDGDVDKVSCINIMNTIGQTIITTNKSQISGASNIDLDVSHLKPGMYFIKVSSNEAVIANKTFVKM